jgi:cytochrome P450
MTTVNPETGILELLSDPSFVADPYGAYRTMLERAPLFWSTSGDLLVSSHELCREVLTNDEIFGQRPAAYPNFHSMDPPEHTRLRRLVSRVFTPRAISAYRHRIEHFTRKLLDDLAPSGAMDLIDDFARPLPTLVITEMLGVPYEDGELWEKWANAVHAHTAFPEFLGLRKQADLAVPAAAAAAEEAGYFRALVAKRRKDRSNDIISLLVSAEEDGDCLTEDELLYTLVLLLGAGHHTSVNLIGNGMRALLADSAQLERVIADSALIDNAIEEMLRIDPPLQAEPRKALVDTFIRDERVPAGTIVHCLIAAANRDPRVFERPDVFDVSRTNVKQHLSFSVGIHHCLGAPLARAEGQVAIRELLRRLPGLRLAGPAERDGLYRLRGLAKLPVAWTA